MKQLSALGARRHAFFRSPRRMRPLGGRLDESEMLGSTPYTYYGGEGPPAGALTKLSFPAPSLSLCSSSVLLLPGFFFPSSFPRGPEGTVRGTEPPHAS